MSYEFACADLLCPAGGPTHITDNKVRICSQETKPLVLLLEKHGAWFGELVCYIGCTIACWEHYNHEEAVWDHHQISRSSNRKPCVEIRCCSFASKGLSSHCFWYVTQNVTRNVFLASVYLVKHRELHVFVVDACTVYAALFAYIFCAKLMYLNLVLGIRHIVVSIWGFDLQSRLSLWWS